MVSLLLLIVIGVPIAFALAAVGFAGIVLAQGLNIGFHSLAIYPYSMINSWLLISIPLFILMGELAFVAGVSKDLYEAAYYWVGWLPGGLAIATVAGCAGFAAACGSSAATAATLGRIAIPEMKRYNYSSGIATGSVAAGGLLGIIIPPSIPLIIYGFMTMESVGELFIAGIIPGVLTAVTFSLLILVRARLEPRLAPAGPSIPFRKKVHSLKNVWAVGLIFFTVMGGIYTGVFTPTEAAAAAALIALVMALAKARPRLKSVREAWVATCQTTGMVFCIIIGTAIFTVFLTIAGLPSWLASQIIAVPGPPLVALIAILAMYIILGMFLDPVSMMLITLPIVYPAVRSLGYNGIWLGILIVKVIEIGLLTPPVGLNMFIVKAIAPDVPLETIIRGIAWFVVAEMIVLILLVSFPILSLWLPQIMWN